MLGGIFPKGVLLWGLFFQRHSSGRDFPEEGFCKRLFPAEGFLCGGILLQSPLIFIKLKIQELKIRGCATKGLHILKILEDLAPFGTTWTQERESHSPWRSTWTRMIIKRASRRCSSAHYINLCDFVTKLQNQLNNLSFDT